MYINSYIYLFISLISYNSIVFNFKTPNHAEIAFTKTKLKQTRVSARSKLLSLPPINIHDVTGPRLPS